MKSIRLPGLVALVSVAGLAADAGVHAATMPAVTTTQFAVPHRPGTDSGVWAPGTQRLWFPQRPGKSYDGPNSDRFGGVLDALGQPGVHPVPSSVRDVWITHRDTAWTGTVNKDAANQQVSAGLAPISPAGRFGPEINVPAPRPMTPGDTSLHVDPLVAAADGSIWARRDWSSEESGQAHASIVRVDAGGVAEERALPLEDGDSPLGDGASAITGTDGSLWFTAIRDGRSGAEGFVARLTGSGISWHRLPSWRGLREVTAANGRNGLARGAGRTAWVAARLPAQVGPGRRARMACAPGTVEAMTTGPDGRPWFLATTPRTPKGNPTGRYLGVIAKGPVVRAYRLAGSAGSTRTQRDIALGPGNRLWLTDTGTTVWRVDRLPGRGKVVGRGWCR